MANPFEASFIQNSRTMLANEAALNDTEARLQNFAAMLGRTAWQNNRLLSVETSQTSRYIDKSEGWDNPNVFNMEILEFRADKHKTAEDEEPDFTVYQIARTNKKPISMLDVPEADRQTLFESMSDFYSEIMDNCLGIEIEQDPTAALALADRRGEPHDLLTVCDQLIEETGERLFTGKSTVYTLYDNLGSIDYEKSDFYELGGMLFNLRNYDSSDVGWAYAHGSTKDDHEEEIYPGIMTREAGYEAVAFANVVAELSKPEAEMFGEQSAAQFATEQAFYETLRGEFGAQDHAGISFMRHMKHINGILRQLGALEPPN